MIATRRRKRSADFALLLALLLDVGVQCLHAGIERGDVGNVGGRAGLHCTRGPLLRRAQRCPEALDLGGERADGGRFELGLAIGLLGVEAGSRDPGRERLHGLGRTLLGFRGVLGRRS